MRYCIALSVMIIFATCASIPAARSQTTTTQPADVRAALRSLDIDPDDVGIDPHNLDLMVGPSRPTTLARLLMCEPLRTDAMGDVIGRQLVGGAQGNIVDLLAKLSRYNGRVVRRGLIGDPVAEYKKAVEGENALAQALAKCGADIEPDALTDVPASVQKAAAVLLLAAHDARAWVRRSQRHAPDAYWQEIANRIALPLDESPPPDPDFDLQHKQAVPDFAAEAVMIAAQDMVFAAGFARQTLVVDKTLAETRFDFRVETNLGWVILSDARPTEHSTESPIAILIDVGGDDTYVQAGATSDREHPISVAIDLAGNDRYEASETALCSFGAGIFGVGLLWDGAGDDVYTAIRRSQGYGHFGVGMLIDVAGNDQYNGTHGTQASAIAGYGILVDRDGDDRYEAFVESQAFAGPNAAAALVDLAGDDRYIANDEDIRFPAPQDPKHNVSMSQGASSGWRADYSDGVSIAGGVGVLVDKTGNDEYTCGVFGQGVGYWYGLGMLIDLDGNDRYHGFWYIQGSAAHFAAGVLLDRGGNDHYHATRNMSQGAGHDLSIGVLMDDAGNDVYRGSTLGLGASNAAGVGLFIDKAGDDAYRTPPGSCLGWVNRNGGLRALCRACGLFIDLAGDDTYGPLDDGGTARNGPGNGTVWPSPVNAKGRVPYYAGYGIDR